MSKEENTVGINIGELENSCFVVMPFTSLFEIQFEKIIRPTIEDMGIKCIRADEIYSKPRIMDDIWKSIRSSRFVLAELTNKNPNVFYEVGLAHAIGKPVIITRNEDDVPFDLKALRYLYYDTNDPFWGENLKRALKNMIGKVIEVEQLSKYLDDIKPIGKIIYPNKPDVSKKIKIQKETIPQISGIWKVPFEMLEKTKHEGTINIYQKNGELSGTMTIQYFINEKITVVQEIFSGQIKDKKVNLNGVNYTYIQRGEAESYNLDNFFLKLSPDSKKMEGILKSLDEECKVIFTKMQ